MIKLRPKRFSRTFSKGSPTATTTAVSGDIKWELRPGGMLVQRRECSEKEGESLITVRVSTVSQFWHDITIRPTSTFGELKMVLSLLTNLGAKEQRLVYRGREREDDEHLHMVGVKDKDKVLLLEDPRRKLTRIAVGSAGYRTISV